MLTRIRERADEDATAEALEQAGAETWRNIVQGKVDVDDGLAKLRKLAKLVRELSKGTAGLATGESRQRGATSQKTFSESIGGRPSGDSLGYRDFVESIRG